MNNQASNGKASVVLIRVSEQEREALQKNAAARGTTVSNYLRSAHPELSERNYPRAKKET
jgi:predicted DNA binding CopG/RHH family protein